MKNINKKGVTFLALVVTIVVALIILSAVVVEYENIVDSTKKSEFAREMYLVRKQVLNYEFLNTTYPVSNSVTIDLNNIDLNSREQFSTEPNYASNQITLNPIDLQKAGVENITRGTTKYGADDIYLFSTATLKIYYLKGESIGSATYYTLTDELYKLLDINDIK